MCGRFTLTVTIEQLLLRYDIDQLAVQYHLPRFNIAPTQNIFAVIHDGEKNRGGSLRWGLIPSWASDEKIGQRMINARAETLAEKPAFRKLIKRKRCIIPTDGFYEWKKTSDGRKQPMRILLKSGDVFSLAGLYDIWKTEKGATVSSCTIITTRPNDLMASIHNRMPVILREQDEQPWLDRSLQHKDDLQQLWEPFPSEELEAYPVSPKVGNVRNDEPELIKKAD